MSGTRVSWLRPTCPTQVGRNCLAKHKTLICSTFSAGTQSFHHQEKVLRPGLGVLAEAGGKARCPHGIWLVTVGTLSPAYSKSCCFDLLTQLTLCKSSQSYTTN